MINHIKEVLTYELFIHHDYYEISIPVKNLVNPSFLLKNKNLYILLYNHTQGFVLKDLEDDVLEAIINRKCYLIENLTADIPIKHIIILTP